MASEHITVVIGHHEIAIDAPPGVLPFADLEPWASSSSNNPRLTLWIRERSLGWNALPLDEEGLLGRFQFSTEAQRLECQIQKQPGAFWASFRLACCIVSRESGIMLHAAGLGPSNQCLAAVGKSGNGKSTLSELSGDLISLSDETILVELSPTPHVHGLPFRSRSSKKPKNLAVPLCAITTLIKSDSSSFHRAQPTKTIAAILSETYRPNISLFSKSELFCRAAKLVSTVPNYSLSFAKSPETSECLLRLLDDASRGSN